MRRTLIMLAIASMALLAGCGPSGKQSSGIPVGPRWKGQPYRLAYNAVPVKKNPVGVTIPPIRFTANPEALEHRVSLVVRYDSSQVKSDRLIVNQVILAPFDISGADGALSSGTMDDADKGLAELLSAYCLPAKVKVSVALARSSLSPSPDDAEVDEKRLSDWITTDLPYKNLKRGCPAK
ncbi:MAG TPA: hypothetical protein VFI20_06490 [Terracidiphilus sp.]|nr:hypothetical protein [Terracidiphilus sp.]